jgi:hypothetical protein
VGDLPSEAQEELEQAQGHNKVRLECPTPTRKRTRACLAESGKMAARTNQRSNATGSGSYVVEDGVEDDSKPSPVTSTALIGLNRGQEVVEEVATPESGQMVSTTNHRGKATLTCNSVGEDGLGRGKEDPSPSPVNSSALRIGSYTDQEVDQEEATTPDEIPSGWTRTKLEPDC